MRGGGEVEREPRSGLGDPFVPSSFKLRQLSPFFEARQKVEPHPSLSLFPSKAREKTQTMSNITHPSIVGEYTRPHLPQQWVKRGNGEEKKKSLEG